MNSQLGNSFFSHSQVDSPLRLRKPNVPAHQDFSSSTNKLTTSAIQSRELRQLEHELQARVDRNSATLKTFALKSEEVSEQLEDLASQTEKVEVDSMVRLRNQTDSLIRWSQDNVAISETNLRKKKDLINDYFEKFQALLQKEKNEACGEFEGRIRVLVNDFQEKRYQLHLQKRKREAELEELKIKIFGKLNEVQNCLDEVRKRRKQRQEKAVEFLSDLKFKFEKRLLQSQKERDENEVVLAQMLDSVISKFD